MKSVHHSKAQRGFFDLGMSLLVLALAGGVIYGAESSHAEQLAAEQQAVAAATQLPSVVAEESDDEPTVVAGASQ